MSDKIGFNRPTYNLVERLIESLEVIGGEMQRYNDLRERTCPKCNDGLMKEETQNLFVCPHCGYEELRG